MRKPLLFIALLVMLSPKLFAQQNNLCQSRPTTLYCRIPSLFGTPAVNPLQPLDVALATQLTLVPLASPASGIVYSINPANKLPQASGTETFGPVLTERGETLYPGKLFVAVTYQRFRFDSLDGVNLKKIPMVFDFCTSAGQCGLIATIVRVDAHLDQYAVFGTYGVTRWLDISAAIPITKVTLAANGVNCVQPYCSFTTPGSGTVSFQNAQISGSASGFGDVVLRAKATLYRVDRFRLAAGSDLRLPLGNSLNFLGAGSVGVKPFLAVSRSGRVSPHVNLAYQWNGQSTIAGAVQGEKGSLPKDFSYAFGVDAAPIKKLTVSVDYLGERVMDASRLQQVTTSGIASTTSAVGSYNTTRGGVGFKWKPVADLLISGNVLVKLDHNGLHHTAVPLGGISYTF